MKEGNMHKREDGLWPVPADALESFEVGMDRSGMASGFRPPDWNAVRYTEILNLGAGNKHVNGARSLDYPEWDAETQPLPYPADSVDVILAYHFLEHVENVVGVLIECQRVLQPGGVMNIVVPYGAEDCWLQDLSHKHMFIEDTWKNLFSNPYYTRGFDRWRFRINFNMIMGLNRRNLILNTQLQKEDRDG